MKVEKEKDLLSDHLSKLRTREQQSEDYLAQMGSETTKLNTIINEADKERQRQRELRREVCGRESVNTRLRCERRKLARFRLKEKNSCFI